MKKVAKIELALTVLLVASFMAATRIGDWLESMPESDPTRQLWESRLDLPCDILEYCTFFPWVAFSVIFLLVAFLHVNAWIFGKLTGDDGA